MRFALCTNYETLQTAFAFWSVETVFALSLLVLGAGIFYIKATYSFFHKGQAVTEWAFTPGLMVLIAAFVFYGTLNDRVKKSAYAQSNQNQVVIGAVSDLKMEKRKDRHGRYNPAFIHFDVNGMAVKTDVGEMNFRSGVRCELPSCGLRNGDYVKVTPYFAEHEDTIKIERCTDKV